jgi:hypothetical protein
VDALAVGEHRHSILDPVEGVAIGLDRLSEQENAVWIVVTAARRLPLHASRSRCHLVTDANGDHVLVVIMPEDREKLETGA